MISIHVELFGGRLDGLAHCPRCATAVELNVPLAELTAGIPSPEPVEPLVVDGRTVHWRLPDDADLAAVAGAATTDEAALLLVSRCVIGSEDPRNFGEMVAPHAPSGSHFPENAQILRELLAERIAAADPYADISFDLACPECGTWWESALDMADFVWAQLNTHARRLLGEVDELARAYGWSEREILGLSQGRRDAYLELVRHG